MYPGQLISMVLGQTTTFLPLQSFYPLRNSQQTCTCSSCQDLIDLTNDWSKMATAPNVNERKYRNKQFFFTKKKENVWTYKKYWNHFLKIINSDSISHLHPCTSTWTRRTCGPKIDFNKEVEINCISLFHFIKTHLIFESLITKW